MIVQENDANMKEMVGGCCVCSDDRGWAENPLVYCDGQGCNVAVHQACYGIVTVPIGNWYCRKCESPDVSKVKCELCPSRDGALKPTDNNRWAHVVCALYIPEVRFGNVTTMEPIILHQVPPERFNKICYICQEENSLSKATVGACMQCNRSGCRQQFHVTCAQSQGLLCEEAGNYQDNVKYCGYCQHHYTRLSINTKLNTRQKGMKAHKLGDHRGSVKKGSNVKVIPPYRPMNSGGESPETESLVNHEKSAREQNKRKLSSSGKGRPGEGENEEGTEGKPPLAGSNGSNSIEQLEVKLIGSKKRKPDLTGGRSGTPQGSPSQSPRPLTPALSKPPTPPTPNGSSSMNKVGSIVVQVPLEATQLAGTTSTSAPSSGGPGTAAGATTIITPMVVSPAETSPPPNTDSNSSHLPAKRSRSESSDKGERRRSRRSGSTSARHRKSSPPSRVKIGSPEPRPSSTGSNSDSSKTKTVIKEEKDTKLFENGVGAAHMLGNQLVAGSSMVDTLSQEMAAQSVYTRTTHSTPVGPHFPRQTPYRGPGSSSTSGGGGGLSWGGSNNIPQSLEQLLERQWEQGSQFLMEQAHHFDIASLLTCLHQLRAENSQLEEHVNSLLARRDHLLAVNARLAIPLVSINQQGGNNVGVTGGSGGRQNLVTGSSSASATVASAVLTNSVTNIVENGLATPQEQYRAANIHRVATESRSTGYSNQQMGPTPPSTQSSVLVRATSHNSTHSQQPLTDRSRSSGSGFCVSSYQGQPPSTQPPLSHPSQVVMRREEKPS